MFQIPKEAKCGIQSAVLCDFTVLLDNEEVVKERCTFCNKLNYFNKFDGRIDNRRYADAHLRDFLQPQGATRELYLKIYGTAGIKRAQEYLEKKAKRENKSNTQELLEYARDVYKTNKRLEAKGKL